VLDKLTRVDYVRRFALVARSLERGVAVARYGVLPRSRDGSPLADVAVTVAPEWRRVGLATALLELLTRRAKECGITDFTTLFLAENRPVTELARGGHAHVVIAEGVAQLHAALTTARPDWPNHNRSEERQK
jgi:GNAT superfamily N-acetyltransferase